MEALFDVLVAYLSSKVKSSTSAMPNNLIGSLFSLVELCQNKMLVPFSRCSEIIGIVQLTISQYQLYCNSILYYYILNWVKHNSFQDKA